MHIRSTSRRRLDRLRRDEKIECRPCKFFSTQDPTRMTSTWSYVSEDPENQISEIWCDGMKLNLGHPGLCIFPWRVRLSTGEVRGLYSLDVADFSGADKKALEDALKNAKELREKWSGELHPSVLEVNTKSCWSCC